MRSLLGPHRQWPAGPGGCTRLAGWRQRPADFLSLRMAYRSHHRADPGPDVLPVIAAGAHRRAAQEESPTETLRNMNTRIPSFLSRPVALAAAALATALLAAGPAQAAHGVAATAGQADATPSSQPLPVVASFSILADLVKQVGSNTFFFKRLINSDCPILSPFI